MCTRKTKYRYLKEGDFIYLDEDGCKTKKFFFGLFSKEVSNKAVYEVISKKDDGAGIMKVVTQHAETSAIRVITVLPNWRVFLHASQRT